MWVCYVPGSILSARIHLWTRSPTELNSSGIEIWVYMDQQTSAREKDASTILNSGRKKKTWVKRGTIYSSWAKVLKLIAVLIPMQFKGQSLQSLLLSYFQLMAQILTCFIYMALMHSMIPTSSCFCHVKYNERYKGSNTTGKHRAPNLMDSLSYSKKKIYIA